MTVVSVCELCQKTKELKKSHILPNSYSRALKQTGYLVRVDISSTATAKRTGGGGTEYMLCGSCEGFLSQAYEKYGTRLFKNKRLILESPDSRVFLKFDYQRFFLYATSILWRASLSKQSDFVLAKDFALISEFFRSCIQRQSLLLPSSSEPGLRLDHFVTVSIVKVTENTDLLPQSVIDSTLMYPRLDLNIERATVVTYYFMVDGFVVRLSVHKIDSSGFTSLGTAILGRIKDRSFIKIPTIDIANYPAILRFFSAAAKAKVQWPK